MDFFSWNGLLVLLVEFLQLDVELVGDFGDAVVPSVGVAFADGDDEAVINKDEHCATAFERQPWNVGLELAGRPVDAQFVSVIWIVQESRPGDCLPKACGGRGAHRPGSGRYHLVEGRLGLRLCVEVCWC